VTSAPSALANLTPRWPGCCPSTAGVHAHGLPSPLSLPAATVDAYPAIREMTEAHLAMPGTQLGDPALAAAAIITVATTGTAPLHQLLGSDSLGLADDRIDTLKADIDAARGLAITADSAPG
jgi:hypothetical protein